MEEDTRKENLKIQHLKDMVLRDINDAHLEAGIVYYIMKDIIRDVENIYNEQVQIEYKEFCDEANAEATQRALESDQANEKPAAADNNEEGAN